MELFLLLLFFYLPLCIVVGVAARSWRGRSGVGWFLLSLLISPLIAGLLVLALPDLRLRRAAITWARESRDCPFCAERIKRSAMRCRYCGADLSAHPAPKVPPQTPIPRIATAFVALLAFIALAVLLAPRSPTPSTVTPIDAATTVTPMGVQPPRTVPDTIPLPRPAPVKER